MPRTEYKYKRIKTSVENQEILRDNGYTPVFSSNVSAIQRNGADLFIRFHNGNVYQYPRKGKDFNSLLTSASKGKWVWANLRGKNVSYNKVGDFPLTGDLDLTTAQMEERLAQIGKLEIAKEMVTALTVNSIRDVALKSLASKSLLESLTTPDPFNIGILSTIVGKI